jgi:hypothetical protein
VFENSRSASLQEIIARQKIGAQEQILKFSHEWSSRVDQLFQDHVSQLIGHIETSVSLERAAAVAAAGFKSRRAVSEELNQLIRRLRQCRSTEEVAAWLVDSTPSFCSQAALFEVNGTRVRGVRARSFPIAAGTTLEEIETTLEAAPAFAHAVQEQETVIAIGSPAEVSPEVSEALAAPATEKVYLYPLVIQERVAAILYATAGEGQTIDGAALELLAASAAGAAQILNAWVELARPLRRAATSPELISIQGVDMQAHTGGMVRQAVEARARWFARAEAARIRLFHRTALEKGRAQHNIYSVLKPQIDAARRSYQKDFVALSPAIADYLHRELITLAHDDASLLGPEYPGSLV